MFHLLTEGRGFARLEQGERVPLEAGDIVIFPHGDSHILENGPRITPVDNAGELARIFSQGLEARPDGRRRRNHEICLWFYDV